MFEMPRSACAWQVSSRRALRADPAFDALVRTLYPDMEDYEAKEVEFISQVRVDAGCKVQVRRKETCARDRTLQERYYCCEQKDCAIKQEILPWSGRNLAASRAGVRAE